MKSSKLIFVSVSVACLVLAGGVFIPSTYADDGGVVAVDLATSKEDPPSTEFVVWPMNTNLMVKQEGISQCLLYESVFPEGGVGYKDSSLPYDRFDDLSAAMATVRAEILRYHYDTVMDVTMPDIKMGESHLTIIAAKNVPSVEKLVSTSGKIDRSLQILKEKGFTLHIKIGDVPSLADVCKVRTLLHDFKNHAGYSLESLYTGTNPREGVIEATVTEEDLPVVQKTLDQYGYTRWVSLSVGGFTVASRTDDRAPWYGGNLIAYPTTTGGYEGCTNSFRINTTATLTAAHCNGSRFTNGIGGGWVGNAMSSLAGNNIDAMLVAGSTYTNRIWVGPAVGATQTIPATGVYWDGSLNNGDSLLISGYRGGQGTLTYDGRPPNGCGIDGDTGVTSCFLMQLQAKAGTCVRGDSGGPVGVWDAPNGRIIPTGIVTGGNTKKPDDAEVMDHLCYVTSAATIAYAYGGATLG